MRELYNLEQLPSTFFLKHLFKSPYYCLSIKDIIQPVMIDRIHFTIAIGKHNPIANTFLIELDESGEVVKESCKSIKLKSDSKELSLLIRSIDNNTSIEIITSPNKYLYGHNLYGSSDIHLLIDTVIKKSLTTICREDLIPVAIKGDKELLGIDINSMLTVSNVSYYLESLPQRLNTNASITKMSNTIYVGNHKKSDTAFRIYDKFIERQDKHKLQHLSAGEINYLEDKLRVELILSHRELQKLNLTELSNWNSDTATTIYYFYKEKLTLMRNSNEDLSLLDDNEAAFFCRYKYTGDPASLIISDKNRRTRYRKSIKEKIGIDIFKPYSEQIETGNPLIQMVSPNALPTNGIPDSEMPVKIATIASLPLKGETCRSVILKSVKPYKAS